MTRVLMLDSVLVDQIAAGEIIERPASVVKELIENALDAEARRIRVEVEDGGKARLQITDDGCGMEGMDLNLAVQRFATSKIRSLEDLNRIQTYGFRGEALPSIGAVSDMTLVSSNGSTASRIQVAGGAVGPLQEAVAARGTRVTVERLFYNVPARRKFLKLAGTETRRIQAWVLAYALAHPEKSFQLVSDGRTLVDLTARRNLEERLLEIYGEEWMGAGCTLDQAFPEGRIRGMISEPSFHKRDRTHVKTFVNGRLVQAKILNFIIARFYRDKIPHGTHPVVVLMVEVDPELVDVNVHPAKLEVRFRHEQQVIAACSRAFENALQEKLGSMVGRKEPGDESRRVLPWETPAFVPASLQPIQDLRQGFGSGSLVRERPAPAGMETSPMHYPETSDPTLDLLCLPGTRVQLIRQVKNRYLLLQMEDALVIMDQHAAHERVLYEAMLHDEAGIRRPTQPLLVPATFRLTPEDYACLEESLELLESIGFQVQPFGPFTVKIDAVPAHVDGKRLDRYLEGLIAFLRDHSREDPGMERLVRGVCRQSAMFGDTLSALEQEELVKQLFACHNPYSCPHGRPTFFRMTWQEIDRKLGRT